MPHVEIPPVVYAPTLEQDRTTRIRMHRMRDDRTALFVYAAMAGLDTLADTGGALLDGAEDVGGAIVDGIGGLFD